MPKPPSLLKPLLIGLLILALGACAVIDRGPPSAPLDGQARWALLPLANHTETPQAGRRAEAILEVLLIQRGVKRLDRHPGEPADLLFEATDPASQQAARRWATEQGARYAITGAVDEWRYKVGVDGEPAVGVALQVIDLQDDKVVWTAVGGKSGWSREALSGVAQKLFVDLLSGLTVR